MVKAKTLQIRWHDTQPIFSVDYEPCSPGRLATCGADSTVRFVQLWCINDSQNTIEFISNLSRHSASVNVVRWSPKGSILASAGDGGVIILWEQIDDIVQTSLLSDENDDLNKENWKMIKTMRATGDIYDIAWSPDASMIISGDVENTVRIWDVSTAKCLMIFNDHEHFVQGVAWDPFGQYFASQSSDRSVIIYKYEITNGVFNAKVLSKNTKYSPNKKTTSSSVSGPLMIGNDTKKADGAVVSKPIPDIKHENTSGHANQSSNNVSIDAEKLSSSIGNAQKTFRMYHDETLISFFRRLTFLIDGSILLTPAGQFRSSTQENEAPTDISNNPLDIKTDMTEMTNTVFMYSRGNIESDPIAHIPGHKRPSIAVRCSPIRYTLRKEYSYPPILNLPYRLIYAVATKDEVYIYDTQQSTPFSVISDFHYATLTDIAWSQCGLNLIMSSSDGFCTIAKFEPGELGEEILEKKEHNICTNTVSLIQPLGDALMNEVNIILPKRKAELPNVLVAKRREVIDLSAMDLDAEVLSEKIKRDADENIITIN